MRRQSVTEALFFATVLTVSFAKLQWEVAGTLSLSDVLTALFLVVFVGRPAATGSTAGSPRAASVGALLFFALFLLVYLIGFFNLDTEQALAQWAKGMVKFVLHFGFLVAGVGARRAARRAVLLVDARGVLHRHRGERRLRRRPARGRARRRRQPRRGAALADHRRRQPDQRLRRVEGASVYRPNALTGDPNHLGIELIVPLLVLLPIYLRLERGHRLRLPLVLLMFLPDGARDALAQRPARARRGMLVLALPYRRKLRSAAFLVPLAGVAALVLAVVARAADFFESVLRSRIEHERRGRVDPLRRLRLHPRRALLASALRARAEQLLRLLRVRHRADELRAALLLRRPARRDGDRRDGSSSSPSSSGSSAGWAWRGGSGARSRRRATSRRRACGRSPGG